MTSGTSTLEGQSSSADRRAYQRVVVALPAFLEAEDERHSVQILDLSAGGAKVDCGASLSSGTKVVLQCGNLRCEAVVRWKAGGALGVCFKSELDARELAAATDRSKALEMWRSIRK